MPSTGTVTVHNGPYTSIPPTASPGLIFLKNFLPALDSLDAERHPVSPFLTPNAAIIVGSQPAKRGSQVVPLLEVRSKHLERFRHDVHVVWDIEHGHSGLGSGSGGMEDRNSGGGKGGGGRRTVMFEATNVTLFKNDPDQFEVSVKEFNVVELEPAADAGRGGLVANEIRTFMDPRPVQDRAGRLHSQSTYAESRSQY